VITDKRGFDYQLEPLRQQATWRLEAMQLQLGAVARQLGALTEEMQSLQRHNAALASWAKPAAMKLLDPTLAHRNLAYLVDAAHRTGVLQEQITSSEQEQVRLRDACRAQQLKLDAIERHHDECLRAHGLQEDRRSAVAADADWLARLQWRRLSQPTGDLAGVEISE